MQGIPQIVLIFLFAILLRWCVTYHPYSGQGKPPIFGDYEAQRHWQEITLNIPIEKWYINTTDNDLHYWGLDYPPLTAYHSLLLGHIANRINTSYVKLYESRGISTDDHKYFMRFTVLCADALTYIPAMIYFASVQKLSTNYKESEFNIFGLNNKNIILLSLLTYPGLILIDYGHFQYNCVSLGLFVTAVTAMLQNSFILGSVFFVAALNYKQMELYHALPIFFYILGKHTTIKTKPWSLHLKMLLYISFTVLFTFFTIWLPFLRNWETFTSVVSRLFPFARGVFEDKVANVWCAINVVYKLRNTFTNKQLAHICLLVTTFATLPSCIDLYLNPKKEKFLISLINSALAFFLFSFQVHEKSILLPAIPVLLYFHNDPLPCFWFLLISHFSMLPLFIKDDLCLAYNATFVFYFISVSWAWRNMFNTTKVSRSGEPKFNTNTTMKGRKIELKHTKGKRNIGKPKSNLLGYLKNSSLNFISNFSPKVVVFVLFYSSILGMTILSIISIFFKPPERYPDLFSLLVSVYSCGHFILFYLYFNYKQVCTPRGILNKYKMK